MPKESRCIACASERDLVRSICGRHEKFHADQGRRWDPMGFAHSLQTLQALAPLCSFCFCNPTALLGHVARYLSKPLLANPVGDLLQEITNTQE